MTARQLFGVGVGPGDPELITVKAVRVLAEAGLVLVPVMAGASPAEPGRAEATVRAHIDGAAIRRVPFALSDRGGVTPGRRAAWDGAAREVAAAFSTGTLTVAFATIGDPNIYSTFSYLAQAVRELVPGVIVQTVPGITAMQDLAARSGTVLTEGNESLALLPLASHGEVGADAGGKPAGSLAIGGSGVSPGQRIVPPGQPTRLAVLRDALSRHDTVVAYKLGMKAGGPADGVTALLDSLDHAGRLGDAVYGARLGLPGEDIRMARELHAAEDLPYLSTLIAPGRRASIGSKLR